MNTYYIIIAVGVFFYLITCIAFIDIARKDFGTIAKKATWGIIAFIPFIGVIIYWLFGRRRSILIPTIKTDIKPQK